jgi:hypothetical protein
VEAIQRNYGNMWSKIQQVQFNYYLLIWGLQEIWRTRSFYRFFINLFVLEVCTVVAWSATPLSLLNACRILTAGEMLLLCYEGMRALGFMIKRLIEKYDPDEHIRTIFFGIVAITVVVLFTWDHLQYCIPVVLMITCMVLARAKKFFQLERRVILSLGVAVVIIEQIWLWSLYTMFS